MRVWFLLLLSFFSCAAKSQWEVSHIKGGSAEFNSSRLAYHSEDRVNGIDLEFLKTKDSLNLYLHVHSRPIPCFQDSPKKAKVTVQAEDKSYTFSALRHEGGQRLLLPSSIQEIIIETLKNGMPVVIHLEGYDVSIEPACFSDFFYKLHYPPRFSSLFHLPI
jgi:hypothetical protein